MDDDAPYKTKLAMSFACVLAMLAGAGILGIGSLSGANDRIKSFFAQSYVQSKRLGDIAAHIQLLGRTINALVMNADDAQKAAERKTVESLLDQVTGDLAAPVGRAPTSTR